MEADGVDFSFDDVVSQLDDFQSDSNVNIEEKEKKEEQEEQSSENAENQESVQTEISEESDESADFENDSEEESVFDSNEIALSLDETQDFSFEDEKSSIEETEKSKELEIGENPAEITENQESAEKTVISEDELLIRKEQIIAVMEKESALLDEVLSVQKVLHDVVHEKNWEKLNIQLEKLQNLSDDFSALEEEREILCAEIDILRDSDISPVLSSVRGKLQKSKVENRVLNEYISTTRKFLQGVFDSVVPQRRNTLYSRTGKIIRNEPTAVAIDIEL